MIASMALHHCGGAIRRRCVIGGSLRLSVYGLGSTAFVEMVWMPLGWLLQRHEVRVSYWLLGATSVHVLQRVNALRYTTVLAHTG